MMIVGLGSKVNVGSLEYKVISITKNGVTIANENDKLHYTLKEFECLVA